MSHLLSFIPGCIPVNVRGEGWGGVGGGGGGLRDIDGNFFPVS